MSGPIPLLPLPPGPATCTVHPLVNSTLTIPEPFVLTPYSSPTAAYRVPAFCFLVTHVPSGTRLMYDLGVRKDWRTAFPQGVMEMARDLWDADAPVDTAELLREGGVDPASIRAVVLSHFHWDHTGNIAHFPHASLHGGPGTLGGGEPGGFRGDIEEQVEAGKRATAPIDFDAGEAGGVRPVGAFERALDYFGDGSVWVVQTAGHTMGHVSLLVRTTSSPPSWVLLGGDTAHHPALLCPCAAHAHLQPSTSFRGASGALRTMHLDAPRAADAIARTRRMEGEEEVMGVVAHDYLYWRAWKEMGGILWPGRGITEWRKEGLKRHREYQPEGYEHQ